MTPLHRNFERWAKSSKWVEFLPLGKDAYGEYAYIVTQVAFESYVASQADVIDMITRQDYVEAA